MVLDLITDPPEDLPYKEIKDSSSHQLTDFQRVEKLHTMVSLGGRKPSDFLHKMMEVCPTGHEMSPFLVFLFLQHLPKELMIFWPSVSMRTSSGLYTIFSSLVLWLLSALLLRCRLLLWQL